MVATAKGDHEHMQVDRSGQARKCFVSLLLLPCPSIRRIQAVTEKSYYHAQPATVSKWAQRKAGGEEKHCSCRLCSCRDSMPSKPLNHGVQHVLPVLLANIKSAPPTVLLANIKIEAQTWVTTGAKKLGSIMPRE